MGDFCWWAQCTTLDINLTTKIKGSTVHLKQVNHTSHLMSVT